jgi:hypothetical protein
MSIQAVQMIGDEHAESNTASPAAETKPTVVRVAKAKAAEEAPSAPPIEKGKLFRWNGKGYEEIVFEDNQDRRVPMVEEAFQAAIEIRKQVQARLRMRPDLSIVASALVLAAAKHPDVVDEVARYGLEMYAKAASGKS